MAEATVPSAVLRGPARGHFRLEHRPPSSPLDDVVTTYWIVRWAVPPGEERVQDVVTRPCVHLSVESDRATVTGVVTRRFRRALVGSGQAVGVRFRPAGFSALWPGRLPELTDQALAATEVFGAEVGDELAAVAASPDVDDAVEVMEGFLRRHRRPLHPSAAFVDQAVDHIETDPDVTRVDQVADHFGISSRTLQRRFERYLGIGPKWVIQRHRILEALDQLERGRGLDWSALAVRLGYADQAHFVNAFTHIVGQPPTHYQRARREGEA